MVRFIQVKVINAVPFNNVVPYQRNVSVGGAYVEEK